MPLTAHDGGADSDSEVFFSLKELKKPKQEFDLKQKKKHPDEQ